MQVRVDTSRIYALGGSFISVLIGNLFVSTFHFYFSCLMGHSELIFVLPSICSF
jgi:hypothetical protein